MKIDARKLFERFAKNARASTKNNILDSELELFALFAEALELELESAGRTRAVVASRRAGTVHEAGVLMTDAICQICERGKMVGEHNQKSLSCEESTAQPASKDELADWYESVNLPGSGPCCPPGRCREGHADPIACPAWKRDAETKPLCKTCGRETELVDGEWWCGYCECKA